jgi:hypothetical protein
MNRVTGPSGTFAIVVGAFLIIEGIWGFFSPVVFGVLTTNPLHAAIHMLLGIAGIGTGLKGGSRGFCLFLGALLLAVGIFWFLPVLGDLVRSLLNVNLAVTYLNLALGIVSLIVGFVSGRTRVVVN